MKRMKKLLTGLLTLGMTLSMMTMTAFAAEPSAKMPTIDTDPDKTGTVTIHKDTSGNGTGIVGNGTGSRYERLSDWCSTFKRCRIYTLSGCR